MNKEIELLVRKNVLRDVEIQIMDWANISVSDVREILSKIEKGYEIESQKP